MLSPQVRLFAAPWTVARQSMGFPRQEYCSGLPFPPPRDLSDPGIKPTSPVSPALASRFFTTESPGKPSSGRKESICRKTTEQSEYPKAWRLLLKSHHFHSPVPWWGYANWFESGMFAVKSWPGFLKSENHHSECSRMINLSFTYFETHHPATNRLTAKSVKFMKGMEVQP